MKFHRMLCAVCTIVFLVTTASAGALAAGNAAVVNTEWTSYTNANWINDLAFDTDGYLWAATSGGAVRWDTSNASYTKYTSEHGLCSNQLSALTVAPDGAVWFASKDNGISRYQDGVFQNYTKSDGMPSNAVNDLTIDPDGVVWIATSWDICSFDGQRFTTYNDTPIKQKETNADFILSDSEGNIWCGSHFYGVYKLSANGWTHYDEPEDISSMVYSMSVAADGSIWASMLDTGLVRYEGDAVEIIKLDTDSLLSIDSVYVQEDGTLWFFNWGDLICVKDGQWETYYDDYEQATDPTCIVEGPDGTIWCGGFMGGLAGYRNGEWTVLQTDDWLPDNTVWKVLDTGTGGLWIVSATAVTYYDGETAQTYDTNWRGLDLLVAPDGAAWVSLGKNGVYRFDGSQWVFYGPGDTQDGFVDTSLGAFLGEMESIMGDDFGMVFGEGDDPLGNELWGDVDQDEGAIPVEPTQMNAGIELGPWYQSIAMAPEGRLLCVSMYQDVHSLLNQSWSVYKAPSDSVTDILVSQQGVYWISCDEGIYTSTDGKNWTFHPEIIDPNNTIYHYGSMYVTPDEVCWIASLSGVGCQPAGGDSSYFVKGDTIPDENVSCVTGAPDGTIWIGTLYVMTGTSGAGACSYDGSTWLNITASDGLASNAVHDISAVSNRIWFATNGGISLYQPGPAQ